MSQASPAALQTSEHSQLNILRSYNLETNSGLAQLCSSAVSWCCMFDVMILPRVVQSPHGRTGTLIFPSCTSSYENQLEDGQLGQPVGKVHPLVERLAPSMWKVRPDV